MTEKDAIKKLLRVRGWTHQKLADATRMKRTNIIGYLNRGDSGMRIDNFVKMVNALGCDVMVCDRYNQKISYKIDMEEEPDLFDEPKRSNGMRDVDLLKDYDPSYMEAVLTNGYLYDVPMKYQQLKTKNEWLSLFNNAIEDLKEGGFIPAKAQKSNPFYWEHQISLTDHLPEEQEASDK